MMQWSSRIVALCLILISTSATLGQDFYVYGTPSAVYTAGLNASVVVYRPVYAQPAYAVTGSPVVTAAYASPFVHAPRLLVPTAYGYAQPVVVPAQAVVVAARPSVVRETTRAHGNHYNYTVHSNGRGVPPSTYKVHVDSHRRGVKVRERGR